MLLTEESFPNLSAAFSYVAGAVSEFFEPEAKKTLEEEPEKPWYTRDGEFRHILQFLRDSLTVGSLMWPHTPSEGDVVVEHIRCLTNALVWAQKNQSIIPTLFIQHKGMETLVGAMVAFQTPHSIRIQAWQTVCMICQNVKQDVFDEILRHRQLNVLFLKNPESEDGCFEYFLSLMKTLAQRLRGETAIHLLSGDDFPLLRKAMALTCHRDGMVRTSARTSYLTLLRLQDDEVQKVNIDIVQTMLLRPLSALLRSQWVALVEAGRQGNQSAFRQAAYDEEETLAHLGELLLLGQPNLTESVAQLLGRELVLGQLVHLKTSHQEIYVEREIYPEMNMDILPSPTMLSPAASPKKLEEFSPTPVRELTGLTDMVVTENFSSASISPKVAWTPDAKATELERCVAVRALAAFVRAMREADVCGVVMPILELLLLPSAPAGLVDSIGSRMEDGLPKDVRAFVEQLAATAMEDLALKCWEDQRERMKYWQQQLFLAPGRGFGVRLVANPFRSSLLDMLETTLGPSLPLSTGDLFSLESVMDSKVAASLAITEMQSMYPKLLVDTGLVRPTVQLTEAPVPMEKPQNGNIMSALSWLFNGPDQGQCF